LPELDSSDSDDIFFIPSNKSGNSGSAPNRQTPPTYSHFSKSSPSAALGGKDKTKRLVRKRKRSTNRFVLDEAEDDGNRSSTTDEGSDSQADASDLLAFIAQEEDSPTKITET
jgi:hypothetical protein